ncbi:DUF3093 domain-containing protein [Trebonia sp.]|uniref:DUF3093 domain-containing protein n=1 Tax=Trebonia sp. TaxID=2767075 RepID=UPI00262DB7E4|nr:DUF3093 domain-containing protein [Trebonia sp.]
MRSYREHLRVPVSYWLLAVPSIVILGAELYAGFGGFIPPLIYAVFTAVVAGFLLSWGGTSIEVANGTLRAGHATLLLRQVGDVVPLDEKQATLLRGPRADPAAHLMLRPYLKRAVYIALADPAGGVPYWLVATRRPAELASAIERSRQTVG